MTNAPLLLGPGDYGRYWPEFEDECLVGLKRYYRMNGVWVYEVPRPGHMHETYSYLVDREEELTDLNAGRLIYEERGIVLDPRILRWISVELQRVEKKLKRKIYK